MQGLIYHATPELYTAGAHASGGWASSYNRDFPSSLHFLPRSICRENTLTRLSHLFATGRVLVHNELAFAGRCSMLRQVMLLLVLFVSSTTNHMQSETSTRKVVVAQQERICGGQFGGTPKESFGVDTLSIREAVSIWKFRGPV